MMELMITCGKVVPRLQLEHGLAVDRVYTGSFMTSLDMSGLFRPTRTSFMWRTVLVISFLTLLSGFSITIMKSDPAILQRLDAPTRAPHWPVAVDGTKSTF